MEELLKDDIMKKAHEEYEKFVSNSEMRAIYEAREKQRKDQTSLIEGARREGMQEGERKKALKDAKNLKDLGVAIDIIVKATGLDKETVEAL